METEGRAPINPPRARKLLPARNPCECEGTEVKVRGLHLRYGAKTILRNINLTAGSCEITAVIGPSGCGKSSFLHTLNRLTDLFPTAHLRGGIQIGGQELFSPTLDLIALRRRVGMIFQKPNPFPISIRRNIELPLKEHGIHNRGEREGRMEQALRDVGLLDEVADRLNAPAMALSGGQQQRLCIARTIALEPNVLLFDEPCSALDPISSGVVEDLILSMKGRYTAVVVTHNLAQARRISDSVVLFWLMDGAGEVIEQAPCGQFFTNPAQKMTADYINGIRG